MQRHARKEMQMTGNKPIYKKWWVWVIIVILVLGIFGAIGGGGKEGGNTPTPSGPATDPTSTQPSSGGDATPAADPTPAPAPEPAKTTFGVGDTQTTGKYTVTLNGFRESSGTNQFLLPEEGKVFIFFEFIIENTGKTDANISTLVDFACYVDDFAVEYSLTAATEEKGDLDVTLSTGKKAKGEIGFEVDKDWKTIEIVFDPAFAVGKGVTFTITR